MNDVTKISIPAMGCIRELWIAPFAHFIDKELIEQQKLYPIQEYATHIVGEIKYQETNNIRFYYTEFNRWEST
jgi:hypothetical protein